ncbi:MAG: proline--tRNA ligase [Candidatus Latescibacteria bacterium]|nr:proline--tRNA ligase [Candidatus Latescibacterota bacterium]
MSQLFGQTLRETPVEAEVASHQLLLRAGFIRQLASGIFSYLPLAWRSLRKVEAIIREEIEAIGGQEISMPLVHPADIWKKTGRWDDVGDELGRFTDRTGRDMALAMTHEEVVADLAAREIQSYRQLPRLVYHFQLKWRDDPRPRSGLIRVREFTMKDSYSLDADWAGLEKQYRAHYQAYFNIFNRCGVPGVAVKSDVGMMGGKLAHEYMYLTPIGEDTLVNCGVCGYSANRQVALFEKTAVDGGQAAAVEKVATPGTATIDALAKLLAVPTTQTAKAVFIVAQVEEGEQFVLALVRGDMELNETKLANIVKARELRPAQDEEIRATGAVPGYGSPMGVEGALVVVDDLVATSTNLIGGANEEGFHLLNLNCGRDYKADLVGDIAAAQEGDGCPECGQQLTTTRGVEVGNIFQLGTRYTDALGSNFLDAEGRSQPVVMGSYGIGVGRLLACIAEEHHDEQGLCWPVSVAPFPVHMVVLARAGGVAAEAADKLYGDLQRAGIEVLFDDRDENPGVKFNDADLLGAPVRLTVGERSLKKGQIEMKLRTAADRQDVPLEGAVQRVADELAVLRQELDGRVVEVPYKD